MESVADRLRRVLEDGGIVWTAPIEHHEVIGSTSDRMKELAKSGAPEWTVVLADRQTAGRGRQGREWVSPAGNVAFSVLLRPAMAPAATAVIPLAAGVAVADSLRGLGVDAELKWPNDVLVGGKKVSGILAEATSIGKAPDAVVLGIGINLVLDPEELPGEARVTTTWMRVETGRETDPVEVVAAVLRRLTVWYHALARDGAARIVGEWRSRSAAWWGKAVEVRAGNDQSIRGIARGVDDQGALLVEVEGGALTSVLSGDARELRLTDR